MMMAGGGQLAVVAVVGVGDSDSKRLLLSLSPEAEAIQGVSFLLPITLLLLLLVGVLCFFGIAKGTKNTSNNQELQTTG